MHMNSSHAFGLAQAVELARTLKALPPRLLIFGIEAVIFDPGATVSGAVQDGVQTCCDQILVLVGEGG